VIDPSRADALLAEVVMRRYGRDAPPEAAPLVAALARAVREDHVAIDLSAPVEGFDVGADARALLERSGGLVEMLGPTDEVPAAGPPLVLVGGRHLYLRRLAAAEWRVARALVTARSMPLAPPGGVDEADLEAAIAEVSAALAAAGSPSPDLAEVARTCLTRSISFVTGGPGTGKTWMVAQILRVLDAALARRVRAGPVVAALAAPTGKAARQVVARVDEFSGEGGLVHVARDREREGSLHRLLGLRPGSRRAVAPLGQDLVVVDEVSMADLDLIDQLVGAASADPARPTRLILVGDPHQLASVEVGAVLADATDERAGTAALISRLSTVHRTGVDELLGLSDAVRAGDVAAARRWLEAGGALAWREDAEDAATLAEVVEHARRVGEAAARGEAGAALEALGRLGVLCATREGPGSVAWWNAAVGARHRREHPVAAGERFSVGEPVLVTRNQRALGLANGDLGVVLERGGRRVLAFDAGRELAVSGVGFVESAWALTIHKSQGSEFDRVVVALPRAESRVVTRELLYTAVTRARSGVTLLGPAATLERALATPVARVSGLTERLAAWGDGAA
jgi:exodeoxyribonuclease V alpha subunit